MQTYLVKEGGKIVVKAAGGGRSSYRRGVRSAVRGFWSGVLDRFEFIDALSIAQQVGLRQAWYEGASKVGISPDELTIEELQAMRVEMVKDTQYMSGFADAIDEGSKLNRGKLTPLMRRGEYWVNRYDQVVNMAMQMAGKDAKLKWIRHASDSCDSCLTLEGRVYRASVWKKHNLRPQHPRLACMASAKGVPVCKCEFSVVRDERVTPGYPPEV